MTTESKIIKICGYCDFRQRVPPYFRHNFHLSPPTFKPLSLHGDHKIMLCHKLMPGSRHSKGYPAALTAVSRNAWPRCHKLCGEFSVRSLRSDCKWAGEFRLYCVVVYFLSVIKNICNEWTFAFAGSLEVFEIFCFAFLSFVD